MSFVERVEVEPQHEDAAVQRTWAPQVLSQHVFEHGGYPRGLDVIHGGVDGSRVRSELVECPGRAIGSRVFGPLRRGHLLWVERESGARRGHRAGCRCSRRPTLLGVGRLACHQRLSMVSADVRVCGST
jgi:hypothetical protein